MAVSHGHLQPSMTCGKSRSSQDPIESNGRELEGIDDDSSISECAGKLSYDNSSNRRGTLQKISEAWKSLIDNQNVGLASHDGDRNHPSMPFKRFKTECGVVFATEMNLISDSDVYKVIDKLLFLVREAELHKSLIRSDYTNLKKVFERDEATVRSILTKSNVPPAITESLLNTHVKCGGSSSDRGVVTAVSFPFSTAQIPVKSPSTMNVPPAVNTLVPPPTAPVNSGVRKILLPDLTQPPPVINRVNVSLSQTPLIESATVPSVPVDLRFPPPLPNFPRSRFPSKPLLLPPITPVTTNLPASLEPRTKFQYSGPFGPPMGTHSGISSSSTNPPRQNADESQHSWAGVKRRYEVV